jgi:hypothetical protein
MRRRQQGDFKIAVVEVRTESRCNCSVPRSSFNFGKSTQNVLLV